jgi:hypothetical protein
MRDLPEGEGFLFDYRVHQTETIESQLAEVSIRRILRKATEEGGHFCHWLGQNLPNQLRTTHPHTVGQVGQLLGGLTLEDECSAGQ